MNGILFESKTGNKYFLDNNNGQIIHIDSEELLTKIQEKYKPYEAKGNNKIIPVTEELLKKYLFTDGNGFKQLILEVTSACNFRCKYCVYSENYLYTREHGSEMMSFETAKKAIDYYYSSFQSALERNPMKQAIIGFYGGEPLLNLTLLMQISDYIKQNYSQYETKYNITTNGYLFNDETQKFLHENKFAILISLDGYKENHDRNRVDHLGRPTYDVIMNNINAFKKNYNGDFSISICFDYKTDMEKLLKFVDENNISVVNVAQVETHNSTYYQRFTQEDIQWFFKIYEKVKNIFFEQLIANKCNKDGLLYRYFGSIYGNLAYHPMIGERQPDIKPFTGTCIPGEKLYVGANGDYQICEKISCSYKIGSVNTGLNFTAIAGILNEFNRNVCKGCISCNYSRLCKLCYKDHDSGNGFNRDENICKNHQSSIKKSLSEYISVLEENPQLFDDITTDYYNFLNEIGEFL